jgi:vacuolar protein sorting-associated protein 26
MASLFGFGSIPVEIDIKLTSEETRRQVELKPSPSSSTAVTTTTTGDKSGEKKEQCPVYYDAESVEGLVTVRVKDGKKLVHEGIRLELVGAIGESRAERDRGLRSEARRKLSRMQRE